MTVPSTLPRLLATLTRQSLLRLLREFSVAAPPGYLSRSALLTLLESAPHVSVGDVLQDLRHSELVGACQKLGVDASGRRHQIVLRLRRSLRWLPFAEARDFVRTLGLQSEREWRAWTKGDRPDLPPRPSSIPSNPANAYRDAGWAGVGDWLGTGTIATRARVYWPYGRAKRFVHALGLSGSVEWGQWCKGELPGRPAVPAEIPHAPSRVK